MDRKFSVGVARTLPFLKNITFQNVFLPFNITFSNRQEVARNHLISKLRLRTDVLQKFNFNKDRKTQNYLKKKSFKTSNYFSSILA